MGDQNVFTTPQQNILVAKALCDTIEPMLTGDHTTTSVGDIGYGVSLILPRLSAIQDPGYP